MPVKQKGLGILKDALTRQNESGVKYQNMFDTIDVQLTEARKQNIEYTLVMPMFKIASTIPAEQYLRKVWLLKS